MIEVSCPHDNLMLLLTLLIAILTLCQTTIQIKAFSRDFSLTTD
jgi:hypothetical protein